MVCTSGIFSSNIWRAGIEGIGEMGDGMPALTSRVAPTGNNGIDDEQRSVQSGARAGTLRWRRQARRRRQARANKHVAWTRRRRDASEDAGRRDGVGDGREEPALVVLRKEGLVVAGEPKSCVAEWVKAIPGKAEMCDGMAGGSNAEEGDVAGRCSGGARGGVPPQGPPFLYGMGLLGHLICMTANGLTGLLGEALRRATRSHPVARQPPVKPPDDVVAGVATGQRMPK
ncbi:hypothetical protein DFH08DRAFT_812173 [Mycena albidolilacea]|uniref:Uncharacterized protein n=1 Tax=Mycena albidolilacea TaxID=1033008 RepID=A0AAD7EP38_9AGAR|nr:hypothetical protein DFH08DRAFT_812173 [Mycena albidolilacea]